MAPLLKFCLCGLVCVALTLAGPISQCLAEPSRPLPSEDEVSPNGIIILDGSYVLDVGELRVNITNHGLIGSQFTMTQPYSFAPSAQWPGGSNNEYLFGAGLWVGGRIGGDILVSTGQYDREFRPGAELTETIYEAVNGIVQRPTNNGTIAGRRLPDAYSNDDSDFAYNEDPLNGKDDDNDGLIDEDFAQIGDQMFVCTMYDNLPIISEIYTEHRPLGLQVVQKAYAWSDEERKNIIGLDFKISNVGFETIDDVYLGFFVDCDIQRRNSGPNRPDDMAGHFSGSVRADNGTFYRADIAYMMDADPEDPLPGCFGVMLIDHTTEFAGQGAPFHPSIRSFQIFSSNASVYQDGEPASDVDRYYLMSRNQHDANTRPEEANDLKYMISSGPFASLEPGESLDYSLAFIIGDGFDGMLQTAIEAGRLGAGRWFNQDNNYYTGRYGRETHVCVGDYPSSTGGTDLIYGHRLNFMNNECAGDFPIMFQPVVWDGTLTPNNFGIPCGWVNMDNCEECFRARGVECNPTTFFQTAMNHTRTGVYGRETHYPWSGFRDNPPPAPSFRIEPGDRSVEIFWSDESQYAPDSGNGQLDFESYKLWRASNWVRPQGAPPETKPPSHMWAMIDQYDVVNYIDPIISGSTAPLSLGENTGLEGIIYTPACLSDDRFDGLAEEMQFIVDSDVNDQFKFRPPVRHYDGSVVVGMEGLVRWETYPTVLDTFFTMASREASPTVIGKRSGTYYHYVDSNRPNGLLSYYSVVAADHTLERIGNEYYPTGYGTSEKPANSFRLATPRTDAQTLIKRQEDGLNIYVYPNPATRQSLEQYLAQAPSHEDPTGVRVTWCNLPLAKNTIYIFTVSGDRVETLHHDGFAEGGSTSWNLMSRNGQEVANGIYLYVVQSDNGDFADVPGKFVVVR